MADYRRYAGPAALLLAVTVAVVLIRVVFASGHHAAKNPPATTATTTAVVARRFWTVRAGDTLAVIARKSGVTVAAIRRLNPHASATTLYIGQKLRLR